MSFKIERILILAQNFRLKKYQKLMLKLLKIELTNFH